MYEYRKMPPEERELVLDARRERGFPLHAPPHLHNVAGEYLITAACYEHCHIFEQPDELSWLTSETLDAFQRAGLKCPAWVFLTNHYHVLVETERLSVVSELLRLLHSRVATAVNSRQHKRGRQVWYRFSDWLIRDERHHLATVNYIHYNPMRHKYVDSAELWAWCSLHDYVQIHGKRWLTQT